MIVVNLYSTILNRQQNFLVLRKIISPVAIRKAYLTPIDEVCHILYKNLVIPNRYEKRVVWLGEVLAQVLS